MDKGIPEERVLKTLHLSNMEKIKMYISKSGNVHSLAGNVIFALFSFATFWCMARTLDKEVFGQWVIYITAASLLDMFRLGLTGTAAIRIISSEGSVNKNEIIGAAYQLGLVSTIGIGLTFLGLYTGVHKLWPESVYIPVLLYYPILSLANLPFNQAQVIAQAEVNFKKLLILRGVNGILMFTFILTLIYAGTPTLQGIIVAHIMANVVTAIVTISARWDGLQFIFSDSREAQRKILSFGKYATASYIGSNLLRSADTIILSLSSVMGAHAIAIYAIPLKFVEIVEIPLRSFTATAFPRLAQALGKTKHEFNDLLGTYAATTTILLAPVILLMLIFSGTFLTFLGGEQYSGVIDIQKDILYVIAAYILLLPLDRYTGVALFSINRPDLNFYKISIMLLLNIIFDLIAVYIFHSLVLVAAGTLLFTFAGVITGWYFIRKQTDNITLFEYLKNLQKFRLLAALNKMQ